MPFYNYQSFNKRGELVHGTVDAASIQIAKEVLQGQGLMPVKIAEVSSEDNGFSFSTFFEKKIEPKTVILFTKQVAVLLKSAVPLLQAIELLIEQFDGKFRRILTRIKDGIKGGEPLAKELHRYPHIFSHVYVQLVRAGEATGKLDVILQRLTIYLERTAETKKRVKKAMTYPIAMFSFAGLVIFGLLTTLVPRLKDMFGKVGKELPAPTKILIASSDFLLNNCILILVCLIVTIVSIFWWRSTPSGKYQIHSLLLKFPLTAYFSRTKAIVQFTKTLGMLLESGVNLSEALDIVCNIVDNKVLTQKLSEARDKIIKEGKIAQYLKGTGIFPNIASYMISTGEQSGKLSEMLLTVGEDYDNELREITDGLTAKITPIMTIVMGFTVGFIVLSIFLPIMSMGDLAGI